MSTGESLVLWLNAQSVKPPIVERLGRGQRNLVASSRMLRDWSTAPLEEVETTYGEGGSVEKWGRERLAWVGGVKAAIASHSAGSAEEADGFDTRLAPLLAEDLSHLVIPGCVDALVATRSIERQGARRVTVVLSRRVPALQWPVLAWWLGCLERLGRRGVEIECVVVEGDEVVPTRPGDYPRALDDLGAACSRPLFGRWKDAIREAGPEPVVYWAGGVRRADGWSKFLEARHGDATGLLRVSNRELLYLGRDCDGPLALLAASWHRPGDGMVELTRSAADALGEIGDSEDLAGSAMSAKRFLTDIVAARWRRRIGVVSTKIGETLSSVSPKAVYAVNTPVMESTAVMNWSLGRGIRPVLLPHSFVSRHPIFPRDTYDKAIVYFSAREVTPGMGDGGVDAAGEELIDVSRIDALAAGPTKPSGRRLELAAAGLLESGGWGMDLIRGAGRWVRSLQHRRTRRRQAAEDAKAALRHRASLEKWTLRLGYLLGWEQHHFTVEVDLIAHARFVAEMSRRVATKTGVGGAAMIVRGKPGFTHPRVFESAMSRWSNAEVPKNLFFSPLVRGLSGFGSDVDLVVATQGSSAHIELMLEGVATIRLEDPDPPVFLSGDGYVRFPESVVPRMTIDELLGRMTQDADWAAEEGARQRRWARSQQAF